MCIRDSDRRMLRSLRKAAKHPATVRWTCDRILRSVCKYIKVQVLKGLQWRHEAWYNKGCTHRRKRCARIVISMSVSVCLAARISACGTTRAIFTKFSVPVAFLRRRGRSLLSTIALFMGLRRLTDFGDLCVSVVARPCAVSTDRGEFT